MSPAPGRGPADVVVRRLVAQLVAEDGERTRFQVVVRWERVDPLAVRVSFTRGDTWLVARELLAEGLIRPAGLGDVQVRPMGRAVQLWVETAYGCADVRFDAGEVTDFLVAAYHAAGPDEATAMVHAQLDAGVAAMLDAPGGAR